VSIQARRPSIGVFVVGDPDVVRRELSVFLEARSGIDMVVMDDMDVEEVAATPPSGAAEPRDDPGAELTPREIEVLRLVGTGKANKEIAATLVISERTARTHVSRILHKLELDSRTQAALWAVREGLVDVAPASR
jgi:DNA-binding CsgD family transcriptional regulator